MRLENGMILAAEACNWGCGTEEDEAQEEDWEDEDRCRDHVWKPEWRANSCRQTH